MTRVTNEKDRVVGGAPGSENLTAAERKFLLDLARETLTCVTAEDDLPEVAADDVPPKLT